MRREDMSHKSTSGYKKGRGDETLVTERDIDDRFGLFQEGTFPDALPDDDQKESVEHAIPKEKHV
jgi:hypothetical protein